MVFVVIINISMEFIRKSGLSKAKLQFDFTHINQTLFFFPPNDLNVNVPRFLACLFWVCINALGITIAVTTPYSACYLVTFCYNACFVPYGGI